MCGPVEIEQIKGKKITVVPILRAGIGMMNGVLDSIPVHVSVWWVFIVMKKHLQPVPISKLASNIEERLVVDPIKRRVAQ